MASHFVELLLPNHRQQVGDKPPTSQEGYFLAAWRALSSFRPCRCSVSVFLVLGLPHQTFPSSGLDVNKLDPDPADIRRHLELAERMEACLSSSGERRMG
ncbi:hypothetical protein AVEN_121440-1 [Araneus ventricosus]|uniref:Uncharacterized protein n=1 Tax=Araneus ventricosus TaxID=182803 RepID=A0A4Y2DL67_ARAVE|nr:hypothetical protein AVEN_121440-1 [Araneus ventricosus]